MDSKSIALLIVGIVIIGSSMAIFLGYEHDDNGKNSPEYDKTGEWYAIYVEVATFDQQSDTTVISESYDPKDKSFPMDIDKIEKNMFSGTLNDIPIIGGVMGNRICFEVTDESSEYYSYVEGTFDRNTLIMQALMYADETFNEIVGGACLCYANEKVPDWPSIPSTYFMTSLKFSNATGKTYVIDDNNHISEIPFTADMKVVEWNNYISVLETTYNEKTVRNICIFRSFEEGPVNCMIAGNYVADADHKISYFGDFTIADKKLDIHLNVRSKGDSANILYTHFTADVNYAPGEMAHDINISGKWNADVFNMVDGTVSHAGSQIIKNFETSGSALSSVEMEMTIDNVTTYKWIGYICGNEVFVIAETDGFYYPLFGHVEGNKMYLCGYMQKDGENIGLYFELTRSE